MSSTESRPLRPSHGTLYLIPRVIGIGVTKTSEKIVAIATSHLNYPAYGSWLPRGPQGSDQIASKA